MRTVLQTVPENIADDSCVPDVTKAAKLVKNIHIEQLLMCMVYCHIFPPILQIETPFVNNRMLPRTTKPFQKTVSKLLPQELILSPWELTPIEKGCKN